MDEEVEERLPVTVGKPLVSKLNLHEPRPSQNSSTYSCSSVNSCNYPGSSSFVEEFASIASASNTWPDYAQSDNTVSNADFLISSRSANVPEETDSPETFSAPQPLVASKSLPYSQMNDANYKFSDIYNFHSF